MEVATLNKWMFSANACWAVDLINTSRGVISAGENRNAWGETLYWRDRNPSHSSTLRHLTSFRTFLFVQ